MDDSQQNKIKELKNVLGGTENAHKKCTTCKLVLVFAFAVLILVMVFVFYVRYQSVAHPVQIPIERTIPLTGAEIDELMLDLKGTVAYPANPHIKPTFPTEPKQ